VSQDLLFIGALDVVVHLGAYSRPDGQPAKEKSMSINPAGVARIMGGEKVLHRRISTLGELRSAVEGGLPVGALEQTVRYVTSDARQAASLRDRIVPRTTRLRRERLKPEESERLERIARVMALAEEVWEDKADAQEFLHTPQPMLEGLVPLELAQSELGARQVEELLLRLEYSLPV
jgi:putative toxin-antitoxin system antitoxin component (TIGR02293 family)